MSNDVRKPVQNKTDLLEWLGGRPKRDGLVIAVRTALRCMWAPTCAGNNSEQVSLMAYRLYLLGFIAATDPENKIPVSPPIKEYFAQRDASSDEVLCLYRALTNILLFNDSGSLQWRNSIADVARIASTIVSWPDLAETSWEELNSDIEMLNTHSASGVMSAPIVTKAARDYFITEMKHANDAYRKSHMGFAADWYETILSGETQDVDLLVEIAGLSDRIWNRGGSNLAELISETIKGYRLRKATPLAEDIVYDNERGMLRMVPFRALPNDLYETGIEKLRDAVADVRRASEKSNSYTMLSSTLSMLERTLDSYSQNPQRVHDDQLLAARRVRQLLHDDYVAADHEVTSFLQVLETNAIDIRAAVSEVAIAVQKRNEIRIQELDSYEQKQLQSTIEAIAGSSDKPLAQELLEDRKTTFSAQPARENVESSYRLTSRLARVARIARDLDSVGKLAGKFASMVSGYRAELLRILEKFVGL